MSIGSVAHAGEVNPATVFDSSRFREAQILKAILEQPEETIDFAKAKLTIDKLVDPSIDVNANIKKIEAIVKTIQSLLPAGASSQDNMLAVRKYIYEAGAWNNHRPYQYDFDDPKGTKLNNKLLSTYLDTQKGNCVSMPLLFIVLGQRLGIDVTASTAPLHVLVKYTDSDTGQSYNLETTSGANPSRDVWYQQNMHITDQALANKIYLQKLTKRETVAVMATLLAEDYREKQEYEKAMMISDVVLKYYPNAVDSMLMKGSLFYRLLAKHYLGKYPAPYLIPVTERPYFEFLSINNRYWFEKAELLGWHEPSQQDEQKYLDAVQQDAGKLQTTQ
ncbi:MAG: transglutaminase-like domain-containing protein [Anaerolineae bacterium]|nr:transglutaminase-like domain-containing protein [Anaerolineae bacterium]